MEITNGNQHATKLLVLLLLARKSAAWVQGTVTYSFCLAFAWAIVAEWRSPAACCLTVLWGARWWWGTHGHRRAEISIKHRGRQKRACYSELTINLLFAPDESFLLQAVVSLAFSLECWAGWFMGTHNLAADCAQTLCSWEPSLGGVVPTLLLGSHRVQYRRAHIPVVSSRFFFFL